MKNLVTIKVHAPSGTIILDRPDKRNALNRWMIVQVKRALDDLHQEKQVRAVILTGAGSAFSAGMDLHEMNSTVDESTALQQWHEDVIQIQDLLETMLRYPKPIIAALNGPAMGMGGGLALAADICLACPETRVGFPAPLRGLVAGQVAPLLVFRMGAAVAARMLLTACQLTGEEGRRLGWIHDVVPNEQLWAAAQDLVGQIAKSAPQSIQATKRMLNETIGEQLGTWLSAGSAVTAAARTTEAAREGMAAFLEKRAPQWP